MSDVAIEVGRVWKRFHRGEFLDSLRDVLPALARRLLGRRPRTDELGEGDFWALQDVSFQVRRGEVLGIIGANGAGKSTLLKILARVLAPNRGHVKVNGRVRALIEIAAGFHPDLTGRENVFLNGTILGMRRREILAKFDEIIDFSGIEPFLDTPVKRYSSGMQARLGFAIAAHLDPEVLIVDEILAVGDADFQKKCFGKLSNVGQGGRTVVFVSHNMGAIQSLCSRAIVLDTGKCVFNGPVREAVDRYLSRTAVPNAHCDLESLTGRGGSQKARFTSVVLLDGEGRPSAAVRMGEPLAIVLRFRCAQPALGVIVGVGISDAAGFSLCRMQTDELLPEPLPAFDRGGEVAFRIPAVPLLPGTYSLRLGITTNARESADHIVNAASFMVTEADVFGTGRPPRGDGGCFFVTADCNYRIL